jgi:putative colanic acid biosynthesis acetyltransferase WcaF
LILANNTPFEGASFSFRNRLARLAWQLVWLLLFRPTPPPLHRWRCLLLRCFGARIAAGCHIYSDARIWAPWNLHMAGQACLGPRVICYSMAPIHLGERVVVSQGAHLCTGSHDYTSATFPLFARPITIGADAWVCTEAFVGPGVVIGEGAVIGARAVAMRSQPAWMVCAGNPCQPFKPRIHPSNRQSSAISS